MSKTIDEQLERLASAQERTAEAQERSATALEGILKAIASATVSVRVTETNDDARTDDEPATEETAVEETQVEVADEALCGVGVVAITKLSVEEQTVVEQSSAQNAFVLCIVESLVACRDVGSEVPVAAVDEARQHVVDLLRDGSAQQTLHRQ